MPNYQHIREICARLLIAKDEEHFQAILTELKIALGPQVSEIGPPRLELARRKTSEQ